MNPFKYSELLENNSKIEYLNLNKGSIELKELLKNGGPCWVNVKAGRSYYLVIINTRYRLTCQIRRFDGGYNDVPSYIGFVTITNKFVLSSEFIKKFELIRNQQRLYCNSVKYVKKYNLAKFLG